MKALSVLRDNLRTYPQLRTNMRILLIAVCRQSAAGTRGAKTTSSA